MYHSLMVVERSDWLKVARHDPVAVRSWQKIIAGEAEELVITSLLLSIEKPTQRSRVLSRRAFFFSLVEGPGAFVGSAIMNRLRADFPGEFVFISAEVAGASESLYYLMARNTLDCIDLSGSAYSHDSAGRIVLGHRAYHAGMIGGMNAFMLPVDRYVHQHMVVSDKVRDALMSETDDFRFALSH